MHNFFDQPHRIQQQPTDLQQQIVNTILEQLPVKITAWYGYPDEAARKRLLSFEQIQRVRTFIRNTGAVTKYQGTLLGYDGRNDVICLPKYEVKLDDQDNIIHENIIHVPEGANSEFYLDDATVGVRYMDLFGELIRWTGHHQRLDRRFHGRKGTAAEAIIVELGAAFLCDELQILPLQTANHANYIASWFHRLENDKQHIITAASIASEAVVYLQSLQPAC